nr:hypothetical protein [Loigolactobacillus binensis]
MKDIQSLMQKFIRKDLVLSVDNIRQHIFDIVGIRVITNYISSKKCY